MNNGIVFRDEDWNRLKKIGAFHFFVVVTLPVELHAAEGNPDEEKIGAFGVGVYTYSLHSLALLATNAGFYSLFSVTEEPFVTSGGEFHPRYFMQHDLLRGAPGQWMGFYWKDKKDQVRLSSIRCHILVISPIPALRQAWATAF